jgi:hypothetical protein
MTNAQEFAAGADPNASSSILSVTQIAENGNDMVIRFASIASKAYRVDCSDPLQSESGTTAGQHRGTGGIVQVIDTDGAAQSETILPNRRFEMIPESKI